jgi:hypothetical protein
MGEFFLRPRGYLRLGRRERSIPYKGARDRNEYAGASTNQRAGSEVMAFSAM